MPDKDWTGTLLSVLFVCTIENCRAQHNETLIISGAFQDNKKWINFYSSKGATWLNQIGKDQITSARSALKCEDKLETNQSTKLEEKKMVPWFKSMKKSLHMHGRKLGKKDPV